MVLATRNKNGTRNTHTFVQAGYRRGRANPCLFHSESGGVSLMVHGDDFAAVGPEWALQTLRQTLSGKHQVNTELLGQDDDGTSRKYAC